MKFESDKKARGEILAALALFSQIGITILVTVALMLFLGVWIDGKLGTSPLFLLICMLLGVGGSISGVFRMCARFYNKDDLKNIPKKTEDDDINNT